jgi:hypothetical protein
VFTSHGRFRCRRYGRDDACTARLAEFNGGKTHAARCTEHQQGFSSPQSSAVLQRMERCAVGQQQCRGRLVRHFCGNRHALAGRGDELLSEAAMARVHEHPIADLE